MFRLWVCGGIKVSDILYTEFTPDLKARVIKHNSGFVKATKHRLPMKLIYYEAYENESDARSISKGWER
jgi:predicted GIY-YIG superfamily endonuclease